MNPKHAIHRMKLDRSIQFHRKQLEPFRANRVDMVRAFAGAYYGDHDRNGTVANLLLQTAEAYTQSVISQTPRVLAETWHPDMEGFAAHYAASMNALLLEIRAGEVFKQIGLDAFFGLGIAHVRLAEDGYVELEQDVYADPGNPLLSRISFDNWVHDTMVDDIRMVQCAGNMYRLDWEAMRDSDLYDQNAVKQVSPSSKRLEHDEQRAQHIAHGQEVDDDEYRPMIDVVDIWLPREKKVVTFACRRNMELLDKPPLAVRDWTGAETGPYLLLNLSPVPDNIMPTSPAANLFNLHKLCNTLLRKLNQQAKRSRVIPIFEPDSADDAERLKNAPDGQWTAVKRKDGVGALSLGGVDQSNMVFEQAAQNLYDRMASNLKARLGLGPQADTATQDVLINQQVAANEGHIANQVLRFVERCVRDLGRLLWEHPTKEVNSSVYVPRYGRMVASPWRAAYRRGELSDYNLMINPYSLAYRSPERQAAELRQLVAELSQVIPAMQMAGGNPAEYVAFLAERYCQPALRKIFPLDQLPGRIPAPQEAQTPDFNKPQGNYTRTNVNGGSQENSALVGQMSFGSGSQQQMAQVA